MGIDVHTLNFLSYLLTKHRVENLATLGRHELHISPSELSKFTKVQFETELKFGSFVNDEFWSKVSV